MTTVPGYEPTQLGLAAVAVRLLCACVLAGLLGFERERKDRAAGLRTYVLTALAASLFTIITLEIGVSVTVDDRIVADPIRVVDAVTAGVAFLAAGTIISKGGHVEGLTTGAGMWMAGALGVACGAGYYPAATLTCLLALSVLIGLRWIEHGLFDKDSTKG